MQTHTHTPSRRYLNVEDYIENSNASRKNRRYIYVQTTDIDLNRTLKSNNYNYYFPQKNFL